MTEPCGLNTSYINTCVVVVSLHGLSPSVGRQYSEVMEFLNLVKPLSKYREAVSWNVAITRVLRAESYVDVTVPSSCIWNVYECEKLHAHSHKL